MLEFVIVWAQHVCRRCKWIRGITAVDTGALIANWVCWGVVAIALGLILTVARSSRYGRFFYRFMVASVLVIVSANLVNLYTRARWAIFLFSAPLLVLVMGAIAENRRLRRAAQPTGGSAP
jgi:hypothetical protein